MFFNKLKQIIFGITAFSLLIISEAALADYMNVLSKRLTITGSMLRPQTPEEKLVIAQNCESNLWPMIDNKELKSIVDTTFPLGEAAGAHELMESSRHMGKIVLEVAAY